MKRMIFALIVTLGTCVGTAATAEFSVRGNGGNCYIGCEYVYIDGVIERDTASEFKKFLDEEYPNPFLVIINSPGGDLIGGLELGKIFAERELNVFVGKSMKSSEHSYYEVGAGVCFSSCAYALLGGVHRGTFDATYKVGHEASEIGFHQFYRELNLDQRIEEALDDNERFSKDQFLLGLIVEYLFALNANPRIAFFASAFGKDELFIPTEEQSRELGIVRYWSNQFSQWKIEPYRQSFLIFSRKMPEQDFNLLSQATLFCVENQINLLLTSRNTSMIRTPDGWTGSKAKKFPVSGYGWEYQRINISSGSSKISFTGKEINERFSQKGDTHYAQISLQNSQLEFLRNASTIEIKYDLARVEGVHSATLTIDHIFRKTVTNLLAQCG